MPDTLVTVDNVSKKFCRKLKRSLWYGVKDLGSELIGRNNSHKDLRKDEFWAVKDVSFELKQGDTLGLIGSNGAGKTTLLRMINGLIKPDRGRIEVRGRMQALIALGAGFNPILTGRENIYINASVLGILKAEVDRRFDEIVQFAGIEEFIDTPVQNYSSGMAVRLGFSVAAHVEPDVLLVDEVLAVGDVNFQKKCFQKMNELLETGTGVILVSHSAPNILTFCKTGLLLYNGKALDNGDVFSVMSKYSKLLDKIEMATSSNGKDDVRTREGLFINSIRLLGQNGNEYENNEIPFLNPFSIEIDYKTEFTINNPLIWGNIVKGTQLVTTLGGHFSKNKTTDSKVLPRKGKIKFAILNQNLAPGPYKFILNLRGHDSYIYEQVNNGIASFLINDDEKIKGFLYNKKVMVFLDSEVSIAENMS